VIFVQDVRKNNSYSTSVIPATRRIRIFTRMRYIQFTFDIGIDIDRVYEIQYTIMYGTHSTER